MKWNKKILRAILGKDLNLEFKYTDVASYQSKDIEDFTLNFTFRDFSRIDFELLKEYAETSIEELRSNKSSVSGFLEIVDIIKNFKLDEEVIEIDELSLKYKHIYLVLAYRALEQLVLKELKKK